METPFGFLVIDKPTGVTSHDCVNQIRKIFKLKRVGHGGTLDPAVSGVLPIALGNATRLLSLLPSSKEYIGKIQLGQETDTDDLEGKVISRSPWPNLNKFEIEQVLNNFRGSIEQVPPQFSSIHIKGERAYKKARRGETFIIPKKNVTIYKLELLHWDYSQGVIKLKVFCSSGTYIRSLARDIGKKLKCGGTLSQLRRIKALGFSEEQCMPMIFDSSAEEIVKPRVYSPIDSLKHLPKIYLKKEEEEELWKTGRKIIVSNEQYKNPNLTDLENVNETNLILIIGRNGTLYGVGIEESKLLIQPKIVFNAIG